MKTLALAVLIALASCKPTPPLEPDVIYLTPEDAFVFDTLLQTTDESPKQNDHNR